MKAFSASEAAFEGFRVMRNHPTAIVAWSLASAVVQLAIGALMLKTLGPQFALLSQYSGFGNTMPPAVAAQVMGPLFSSMLVVIPVSMVVGAVFLNAVFRPVLRPRDKGLFFFKIGRDELNIFLLELAWIGVGILAEIALLLAAGILVVVVMLATGGGKSIAMGAGAGAAVGVIVALAVLCLMIWVAVRFSLAAPMTFADGRVRVFGSWRLTKGRFWPLLGCYLLAIIFAFIIGLIGTVVGGVFVGALFGASGGPSPLSMASISSLQTLAGMFTIGGILKIAIGAVFHTLGNVVILSAIAAAYRALTAAPEIEVFSDSPSPWR